MPPTAHPLAIRTTRDGAAIVVAPVGEVDASSVQEFVWAIDAALADRPAVLCVDLSAVVFADSSALAALVRTRRITSWRGIALTVVPGDGPVRRLLELTGFDRIVDTYPTVEAALQLDGGRPRPRPARRRVAPAASPARATPPLP
jgi:anti-anti-sigma factor